MFMSDQMKQMRAEIHAIRDAIIFNDREHIAAAAKTVVIMHFILPNLVQYIANGFAWDDEDQLKATILGPFTATAVVGQILSAGVSLAMKAWGNMIDTDRFKDIDAFEGLDMTIFGPFNKLKDHISKLLNSDDITGEDLMETLLKVGRDTIGPYTGLPIKYVSDVFMKTPEYRDEGQALNMIKLWLGISPYIIENKGQED